MSKTFAYIKARGVWGKNILFYSFKNTYIFILPKIQSIYKNISNMYIKKLQFRLQYNSWLLKYIQYT